MVFDAIVVNHITSFIISYHAIYQKDHMVSYHTVLVLDYIQCEVYCYILIYLRTDRLNCKDTLLKWTQRAHESDMRTHQPLINLSSLFLIKPDLPLRVSHGDAAMLELIKSLHTMFIQPHLHLIIKKEIQIPSFIWGVGTVWRSFCLCHTKKKWLGYIPSTKPLTSLCLWQ